MLLSDWSSCIKITGNPSDVYTALEEKLRRLEHQLGSWTSDKILALMLHQLQSSHILEIAAALDGRLTIKPALSISSKEILKIALRLDERLQDMPVALNTLKESSSSQLPVTPTRPPK